MEGNAWITGLITFVSVQMDTVGGTANKVSSLTVGNTSGYIRDNGLLEICANLSVPLSGC